MGKTLHRIKEFITYKGLSNRAFEASVGLSNGSFSSQLKNNKTIGVDKIENILHVYPELNPIWLLKGTGDMLIQENLVAEPIQRGVIEENRSYSEAEKDAIIKYQEDLIIRLKGASQDYEKRLAFLENMVEAFRLKTEIDTEIKKVKKESSLKKAEQS